MGTRSTRRALRHSLIVDVEIIDLESRIEFMDRTKDLNLYGCRVSTATPFPAGTKVLKIAYGQNTIRPLWPKRYEPYFPISYFWFVSSSNSIGENK
jgi:hypothetical protein